MAFNKPKPMSVPWCGVRSIVKGDRDAHVAHYSLTNQQGQLGSTRQAMGHGVPRPFDLNQ
jgi:hypothetical protein